MPLTPLESTLTKTAFASPLDTTLTSKRAAKSFSFNTYEKHTGGEGGGWNREPPLANFESRHRVPLTCPLLPE
jgi:hypothetical protein